MVHASFQLPLRLAFAVRLPLGVRVSWHRRLQVQLAAQGLHSTRMSCRPALVVAVSMALFLLEEVRASSQQPLMGSAIGGLETRAV